MIKERNGDIVLRGATHSHSVEKTKFSFTLEIFRENNLEVLLIGNIVSRIFAQK